MAELQECLLCSGTAEKERKGKGNYSLKKQIRTLFILRKILEISSSTCSNLLLHTQNNPSTWFSCCAQCFGTVTEAEKIFSQLTKLEAKWKRLKISLELKVLNCVTQKTGKQSKQKYRILELIRQETAKRIATMESADERTENPSPDETLTPNTDGDLVEDVKVEKEELNEDLHEPNENFPSMDFNFQKNVSNSTVGNAKREVVEISKRSDGDDCRSIEGSSEELAVETDSDFMPSENSEDDPPKRVKTPSSSCRKRKKGNKLEAGDYRCEYCPKPTYYATVLKKKIHQTRSHGMTHAFKCPFCSKNLSSLSLLRHVKSVHPKNTFTDIPEDDNVLPDVKQYDVYNGRSETQIMDIKVEGEEKTESPPKQRVCKSKRKYRTVKTVSWKIKCDHCPKFFVTAETMKFHAKRVHADLVDSTAKFPCHLCGKIYVRAGRLARHIKSIHDVQAVHGQKATSKPTGHSLVSCEECDKTFKRKYLQTHISVVHRKERNYICEKCPESFTSTSYLRYHQIKVHGLHGDRPNSKLECKECGRVFSHPSHMKEHVATVHRKEFKVKCPICGVGRTGQGKLDMHIMLSHTDNRPHGCSLCPKSYIDKHGLTVHMRTHTGEKPFSCSVCAKRFHSRTHLGRHVKSIHASENLFECDKCQKRFPSQSYLTVHKYHAHNNRQRIRAERKLAGKEELEKALSSTAKMISDNSIQQRKRAVNSFRVKLTEHCKESSTAEEAVNNSQLNIHNQLPPHVSHFDNASVGTTVSPARDYILGV